MYHIPIPPPPTLPACLIVLFHRFEDPPSVSLIDCFFSSVPLPLPIPPPLPSRWVLYLCISVKVIIATYSPPPPFCHYKFSIPECATQLIWESLSLLQQVGGEGGIGVLAPALQLGWRSADGQVPARTHLRAPSFRSKGAFYQPALLVEPRAIPLKISESAKSLNTTGIFRCFWLVRGIPVSICESSGILLGVLSKKCICFATCLWWTYKCISCGTSQKKWLQDFKKFGYKFRPIPPS